MTLDQEILRKAKTILKYVDHIDEESTPKVGKLLCGFRDHYLPHLLQNQEVDEILDVIHHFKKQANQYGIQLKTLE